MDKLIANLDHAANFLRHNGELFIALYAWYRAHLAHKKATKTAAQVNGHFPQDATHEHSSTT